MYLTPSFYTTQINFEQTIYFIAIKQLRNMAKKDRYSIWSHYILRLSIFLCHIVQTVMMVKTWLPLLLFTHMVN